MVRRASSRFAFVAVAVMALTASFLMVCTGGSQEWKRDADGVIVLDYHTIDEAMAQGDWMIEFYAPWCGHCRKMARAYAEAAKELKGRVNVAKVDGSAERALSARFHIGGYPSIFFVRKQDIRQMGNSGRSVQGLVHFATEGWKDAPAVSYLKSPFGLVGKFKGFLISSGGRIQSLYYFFIEELQLPWFVAAGFLVLLGLIATALFGLFYMWLVAPSKPKRD